MAGFESKTMKNIPWNNKYNYTRLENTWLVIETNEIPSLRINNRKKTSKIKIDNSRLHSLLVRETRTLGQINDQ